MSFEISFRGKICNCTLLYCSPSQLSDTFEDFADNFELNLDKIANKSPYLLVVYGDFNVKSPNYCDTIYDQAYTASFHQKIESVQYNSALAITGAIRGTSKEKLYHELGLETLEKRR